jgi:hypothetical protein
VSLEQPDRLAIAASNLAVDAWTAEVVSALSNAGVRSILLRGPAIVRWLYDERSSRAYSDIDLLVAPKQFSSAEEVLEQLGFVESALERAFPDDRPGHASTWSRPGTGATVDLHRTVAGARASPGRVWDVLAARTARIAVGGLEVEVLEEPARVLVIALHAAQQGVQFGHPLEDLARALRHSQHEAWAEAAVLADSLEAADDFASGLVLVPDGQLLVENLGLTVAASAEVSPQAGQAFRVAQGLSWLRQVEGFRGKAGFVGRKLFPRPAFMRARSSLARRSRLGLAAAYLWRIVDLSRHTRPMIRGWWRVRRRT